MSEGKIRAIIKRPDERFGHVTNISCTLENLQRTVGGYIETVTFPGADPEDTFVIICNEEGLIRKLPFNSVIFNSDYRWMIWDPIPLRGDIIVLGVDEDEFTDCPLQLADWKKMVFPDMKAANAEADKFENGGGE